MENAKIETVLKEKLGAERVTVEDESGLHKGHRQAQGGGHYRVTVVAGCFEGKPALERHRMVYQALESEMGKTIHALGITARTPDEDLKK